MSSLSDNIADKANRQKRMMERFTKQSSKSFDFMSVKVKRDKGEVERERGLIVPHINYIEDTDG